MKLKKVGILAKGLAIGAGTAIVCVGSALGLIGGFYYGIRWIVRKYELSDPMIGVLIFSVIAFLLITGGICAGVIDEENSKENMEKK